MSHPVLFHVGYHKTATTWMQKRLFTERNGFRQVSDHGEVFGRIVRPHGLHFDPEPMRALLATRRDEAARDGLAPVVSSEILSGHPFYAGQDSDVHADRLKAIASEARILISIRNQMRILPSIYMQYLLRGGTLPPRTFFAGTEEPGYFGFDPRHFEYDRLVARYQELFGIENVLVVTQESLKADMDTVSRRIARFAGNDRFDRLSEQDRSVQSPSYPEYAIPILRRINHLQRSTLNPVPVVSFGRTPYGLYKVAGYFLRLRASERALSHRRPASDQVQEQFAGHYAESNRRLEALTRHDLDLSAYER